jgi:hypothetical protein
MFDAPAPPTPKKGDSAGEKTLSNEETAKSGEAKAQACVNAFHEKAGWSQVSPSTQYQLLRSPRSNPTVNFC